VQDTVGRALPDVQVAILEGPFTGRTTSTDQEGRFAFGVTVSADERVALSLSKDGYSTSTPRVRGNTELRVTLTALNLLNLEGRYALSFTVAPACATIPSELRSRTYEAAINPLPSPPQGHFTSELGGGAFYEAYDTFWAAAGHDAARFSVYSRDALNWWLEDQPIIERLGPSSYLAFMGSAVVPIASSNGPMSGSFNGSVTFCPAAIDPSRPDFPPTCAAPVECQSDQHRLTLTRR
jgi:hypothetical protein